MGVDQPYQADDLGARLCGSAGCSRQGACFNDTPVKVSAA